MSTLEEVKEDKADIEVEISRLLMKFAKTYDVEINGIDITLQKVSTITKNDTILSIDCNLYVSL